MSKSIKSGPSRPAVRLVTVDEAAEGQRVDNFLIRHLRGVPKSHIYRLLRSGQVRVNGGRIRAHYRLRPGDRLRVPPVRVATQPLSHGPPPRLVDRLTAAILQEDADFIVLDKPCGVAVHGGTGNPWGVIETLRAAWPGSSRLTLAHRLDRDTSGCLVLARRRRALLGFQDALRAGTVTKEYLVLLHGRLERRRRVEVPLVRQAGAMRAGVGGKPARTEFEIVQSLPDATLVRARLHTGRMHQIRVHAAHLGHPVLGDEKYGDFAANRAWRRRGLRRIFLHAARIAFRFEGRGVEAEASLPPELDAVLSQAQVAS